MLWVVFGVLAICVLGFVCSRVLKGRTGLEAMYHPDSERAARQQVDATVHETRVHDARDDGFPTAP